MVDKMVNYIVDIKSPLRYPGGKTRALKQILPIIPKNFSEFREPMIGGGSIFFASRQLFSCEKYWINDINEELYFFWKYCQKNLDEIVCKVKTIKESGCSGDELFVQLKNPCGKLTELERAIRFFVLNRITFSGLVDSGSYSNESFEKRFTESSIVRLEKIGKLLNGVSITNFDYTELLYAKGKNVFIFLDPPYMSNSKSGLYGKNGHLHKTFNHQRFAENMRDCEHKWLITYDDTPDIREMYSFANISEWKLQYGMNNYKQKSAAKGRELFISNYKLPSNTYKKVN